MIMAAYVDYDYYLQIYGNNISDTDFARIAREASRKVDIATTGIDNIKKLKTAFPTDEDDAEAVKMCICKIINVMWQINQAEIRVNYARDVIKENDGSVHGRFVTSKTAGNESISYSTGTSEGSTLIDKVMIDKSMQENLYREIIREYLSGITDCNGVNLLYAGRYPNINKG